VPTFAALVLARDKRGIAVELKGKKEDVEEILQKRVEREIREGEIRAVRNLGGLREGEEFNCCYCLCNGGGMGSAVGWVVKEVREGKSVLLCTERLDRLPI